MPAIYPPVGVSKIYDGGTAMQGIQVWLSTSAQQVILVYGENDPWSAGALAVTPSDQARGVWKFIAPAGNHGSKLATLASADNTQAYALLAQWLGAPVTPAATGTPAQQKAQSQTADLLDTFVIRRPLR